MNAISGDMTKKVGDLVFEANDDGWSQKVPNNGFEEQPHSKGQLPRGLPLSSSRVEQIFPKLTPAQITRIAMHGHLREIQRGEVLVEQEQRRTVLCCDIR